MKALHTTISPARSTGALGLQAQFWKHIFAALLFAILLLNSSTARAQTGGEGGIQGTVTDATGGIIPNATVVATDTATGKSVTRQTTSDGLFTISPVIPGIYTVSVKAQGFSEFTQKNLAVDALKLTGLNVKLAIGAQNTEITVESAPPALETTNAQLGAVLENSTYENLPLQMSGQQRDPTAFAVLVPGVQGGARAPIIGGTGNYLAAVYADGIPVNTINQQGDNRVIANSIPVEAIDQFQVVTSTPAAEYEGAGLINFTLKSGGNQYHGVIADYVRARMFDAWSFASKTATVTNAAGQVVPGGKPDEHQNEFVASGGGPIPFTKHKGFIHATYDRYHGRSGINPSFLTVPTALMRQGNFTELLTNTAVAGGGKIYDPTSVATCTAANAGVVCRSQFAAGGLPNVIPVGQLSPIALKMQSYLPAVTNANFTNNFYGGVPSGYDNYELAGRADYDLTPSQRLSVVGTYGVRKNVPFTVGANSPPNIAGVVLPLPYTNGGYATIKPIIGDIEHAWQISPRLTNQFKFGFNRFAQPVNSLTDGIAPYRAVADLGITNLPMGQASTEFPGATFGTNTAFPNGISGWTANGASGATQVTVPNTYTLLDNFLIVKGKHSITIGGQIQWLEDNVASQAGYSGIYTVPYSPNSTAPITSGTVSSASNGFSYASYILGAASSSGIAIQSVSETGGRYRDMSPYFQDDWKLLPNLTLNLGVRYDYFPPFHEVQDRWSFLNPNITNTVTGNAGALQFAGNHGGPGVSCGCRTPVNTWLKNVGPRIGFSYSVTPRTVIRAGYGLIYSIGGGVGGRGGAGNGTGALGFNVTATSPSDTTTGAASGPSYYLNNGPAFQAAGIANTNFGGPTYALPTPTVPSAATQTLSTGNYINSANAFVTAAGVAYADPYLSGRAPEFSLFNAGLQQAFTNSMTLTLNYAGTQSHFLLAGGANGRGYWSNQLNPAYLLALGGVADSTGKNPLLSAIASPANVAIAQANLPGYTLPYASISATNTKATIAQTLVAFPQYSGVTDTWGQNIANINYHSLQVSLSQRASHGLQYTFNYTWSKNIGDDGTFRSGYDLPAGVVSGSNQAYKQNRIDRALTVNDIPQNISAYGVWNIPFGQGISNRFVRALATGYQVSTIYRYNTGTPLAITYAGCAAPSPAPGTCTLDYNPNFSGNPRLSTLHRTGVATINPAAFKVPDPLSTNLTTNYTKIGNISRTAPYGLRNPVFWNDDIAAQRDFRLFNDRYHLIARVTCTNVANKATLTGQTAAFVATATPATNTLGSYTGAMANARDFQFSGRFTF